MENTRRDVIEHALQNIEKGETWHRHTNVREIVFVFNDAAISILALIASVIGGALTRGQVIVAALSGRSSQEPGYRRSRYDCRCQDHTGRGWGR
jgi:hypothetical protein